MKFIAVFSFISAFASLANARYIGNALTHGPDWQHNVFPHLEPYPPRDTSEKIGEEAETLEDSSNWDGEPLEPGLEKAKRALESSNLQKRLASDFDAISIRCESKKGDVEYLQALPRIGYLYDVGGKPVNGPGPGTCTRVSCAYNTGVVWCNDSRKKKVLNSFADIANGAMAVLGKCAKSEFGHERRVMGQAFHRDNWNVIVRKEKC
ncbi:hypothetical protein BJX76DRAFT_356632 [Aspergillus varians]